MSVYVDAAMIPWRGMLMSHMVADSTEELLEMADKIGLSRTYIQKPGTEYEHLDVGQAMRKRAVANGALEVTDRDIVEFIRKRRAAPK